MSEPRGELALVERFRRAAARDAQRVPLGIGDDMAVVRVGGGSVLLTADMLLDGVHFDSRVHSPEQMGRKAIACSLSDCAAMAAQPVAATVSLGLPESMSPAAVERMFAAMVSTGADFGCGIAGGDTTSWAHPLVIDVAMLAETGTARGPVRRDGARAGDAIYVTGALGGSLAGRHLDFAPRVREALRLAEALGEQLHAMMDLSDGLSLDLHRLCTASGVGAELEAAGVDGATSAAAREAAQRDRQSAREHALSDGEDYELLIVAAPEASLPELGVAVTRVGTIVAGAGMRLREAGGGTSVLEPRGYEHFRGAE